MPPEFFFAPRAEKQHNGRRIFWLVTGLAAFLVFYFLPLLPVATDTDGDVVTLSREAQAAIGLFVFAAIWWVFEVVPIGVTAIAVAVLQAVFLIRPASDAYKDFMDPSVWFIIGSLVIGLAFTRTGLTNRIAYRMLTLVGDRSSMIYLGCFTMTAGLTLLMAHTAVAAAVFPLLTAVHALYGGGQTRFGAGLFIGMAYAAGAGSIITLLGAARGAVAIGFFRQFTGREVGFAELTYYMAPVGITMLVLIWLLMLLLFPPEHKRVRGLKIRARRLHERLGPMTRDEVIVLLISVAAVGTLVLRAFVPELREIDKSAVLLVTTVLFFALRTLKAQDINAIPWNIILLFGGAMSIGYCLWDTGAAQWLAFHWLGFFRDSHWFVFLIATTFFIYILTNLVMNVAAIAISLPVALAIAPHLGVAPDVVLFAALVVAGMPFLFLVGAAPNAIAYESQQFSAGRFFLSGVPATAILMAVTALFVWKIWPWMGMAVTVPG